MSFLQVTAARVNCVDWVSMPEGSLKRTVPLEKVGSGKLLMPCERMQPAALR